MPAIIIIMNTPHRTVAIMLRMNPTVLIPSLFPSFLAIIARISPTTPQTPIAQHTVPTIPSISEATALPCAGACCVVYCWY